MSSDSQQRPLESAQTEQFVVVKTDDGFRVFSALAPGNQWKVQEQGDTATCTCPEYEHHASEDPEWRCKHIQAVIRSLTQEVIDHTANAPSHLSSEPDKQRTEPASTKRTAGRTNIGAEMLIKRSVSPDGRIDSLSVEFAYPISKASDEEIQKHAEELMQLQAKITDTFRKGTGNGAAPSSPASNGGAHANGAVPAQLLAVAGMNGKFGRRLFLTVQVNGQISKFFGNQKQLAEALAAAGFPQFAAHINEGVQLNLPCRVITRPSSDGKYLNIDQVLSAFSPTRNGG